MRSIPLPDLQYLETNLAYDSGTGNVFWKVKGPRRVLGRPLGSLSSSGYLTINLRYRSYQLHRVIWKIVTREDPGDFEIDHRNGIKTDNAWRNLRKATKGQNQQNSPRYKNCKSGLKGVSWKADRGAFVGQVRYNNVIHRTPYFSDKYECQKAVIELRETLHGKFSHNG